MPLSHCSKKFNIIVIYKKKTVKSFASLHQPVCERSAVLRMKVAFYVWLGITLRAGCKQTKHRAWRCPSTRADFNVIVLSQSLCSLIGRTKFGRRKTQEYTANPDVVLKGYEN